MNQSCLSSLEAEVQSKSSERVWCSASESRISDQWDFTVGGAWPDWNQGANEMSSCLDPNEHGREIFYRLLHHAWLGKVSLRDVIFWLQWLKREGWMRTANWIYLLKVLRSFSDGVCPRSVLWLLIDSLLRQGRTGKNKRRSVSFWRI